MKPTSILATFCLTILWLGCTSPAIQRSQSPEIELADEVDTKYIGDLARPFGMEYIKVEGTSLVTGLHGTGEDPPPGQPRAAVLAEMSRRSVPHPEKVLASNDTAVVLVRAFLRPGLQKGDTFDVEVQVPSSSQTSSLYNGWLLETRLTELAVLENRVHSGHLMALAQGPVLVAPAGAAEKNRAVLTKGRVLGGGMALKSRNLGLLVDEEYHSIRTSQQIGNALNKRFYTHISGVKRGIATPKTDEYVELAIHPRYRDNIGRFMRVVRNCSLQEDPTQHQQRLQLLERQLLDPVTSATAALRLEAIGPEAIDALKRGLAVDDAEVRYYAAESLAYLDQSEAAEPLAKVAREEPAFRVGALSALSAMDDLMAHEQLVSMLNGNSAETRYGAFRALWAMNSADQAIRGEQLGGQFNYHVLDTTGQPMVHITRNARPEIVLFGLDQTIKAPAVLDAGKRVLVNVHSPQHVTVSHFAVGEPDQKREVSNKVDDIIRAIVELGGTYPDVVHALQQAKDAGVLSSRLRVDALPEVGREYDRERAVEVGRESTASATGADSKSSDEESDE